MNGNVNAYKPLNVGEAIEVAKASRKKTLPKIQLTPMEEEWLKEEEKRAEESYSNLETWALEYAQKIVDLQDERKRIRKIRGWQFNPNLKERESRLSRDLDNLQDVDQELKDLLEEKIREVRRQKDKRETELLTSRQGLLKMEDLGEGRTGEYLLHIPYSTRNGKLQKEGAFLFRVEETPKGRVVIPLEGTGSLRWAGEPPRTCFLPFSAVLTGRLNNAPTGDLGEYLSKLARTLHYFYVNSKNEEASKKVSSKSEGNDVEDAEQEP
jgi:hypothetical protein